MFNRHNKQLGHRKVVPGKKSSIMTLSIEQREPRDTSAHSDRKNLSIIEIVNKGKSMGKS